MPELKALYQPGTLAEAQSLLVEHGDRARPLAGGTSLVLSRSAKVEVLVDLGHIGLDRITRTQEGLRVGAMATCSQLRRKLAQDRPTALLDAASSVGTRILQNHVTIGGNCVMVYAWSDLPVAALAMDAGFVIQGRTSKQTLPADAFFGAHPTRSLGEGDLVLELVVPPGTPETGSAHLKFSRNVTDQALASTSVQLVLTDGVVHQTRIVVGAVRGLPQLLAEASDSLLGKEPDPHNLSLAAVIAGREAKVSSDFRASGEYRAQLVASLVEDALQVAVTRAGGATLEDGADRATRQGAGEVQ